MWTKNSAYLSYDDDKMGFVEVGNFADLLLINYEFLTDTPKISRLQRSSGRPWAARRLILRLNN